MTIASDDNNQNLITDAGILLSPGWNFFHEGECLSCLTEGAPGTPRDRIGVMLRAVSGDSLTEPR